MFNEVLAAIVFRKIWVFLVDKMTKHERMTRLRRATARQAKSE
jgi:hypothetical protein